MKLLGSIENKITKDENGENLPDIKVIKVVFVKVVSARFKSLLFISTISIILTMSQVIKNFSKNEYFFKKNLNQEFHTIEGWFTDQNSQPLEIEDKINLTLIIR